MPCLEKILQQTSAVLGRTLILSTALLLFVKAGPAKTQQPPSSGPVMSSIYRPPMIALAVPAAGGSISADKPVVVFRFAPGETTDMVDPASWRAWVDGQDRSALFQMGNGEVWGPLARDSVASAPNNAIGGTSVPSVAPAVITAGVHLVSVRLCSMRGVCATLDVPVTVMPSANPSVAHASTASTPADSVGSRVRRSKLQKLIDLAIAGARKLLAP